MVILVDIGSHFGDIALVVFDCVCGTSVVVADI